jgi:hypothetical protein
MMREVEDGGILLTRRDMYDKVWSQAMRKLAPEWGLSDVGLKKLCKRFEIPTPPVGYWAKLEHGKKVRKRHALCIGDYKTARFVHEDHLLEHRPRNAEPARAWTHGSLAAHSLAGLGSG